MPPFQNTCSLAIDRLSLSNKGVFILTGPSSCGKGAVADAFCKLFSLPKERHLSMGEILRASFTRALSDVAFARTLEKTHHIGASFPVLHGPDHTPDLEQKLRDHFTALTGFFSLRKQLRQPEDVSALDWLEYCTTEGLLVPNRWTQSLIAATLDLTPSLKNAPFIIDGYPRTPAAAHHLLDVLARNEIPVIKVLHLSISKEEMIARATKRSRLDDTPQALDQRYAFYLNQVVPSVAVLKSRLGNNAVALIDAHQPVMGPQDLDLPASLNAVLKSVFASLSIGPDNLVL